MKKSLSLYLAVSLILLNSLVCVAQTENPCDSLRRDIQRVEQMDITKLSPSLREIYKESLLKLYRQFANCLDGEIAASSEMQVKVKGTAAAHAVETRIVSLRAEKADLEKKTLILEIALNMKDATQAQDVSAERSAKIETPKVEPAATSPSSVVSAAVSPVIVNNGSNGMPSNNDTAQPAATTVADTAPSSAPTVPVSTQLPAQCSDLIPGTTAYGDPPKLLIDIVNRQAADVVQSNDSLRAVRDVPQMAVYTIFDAASAKSSQLLHSLEPYQYLGETARTDKQLGGPPKSDGAVSGIEKPGFAQLLGLAIEHGGITKENDGTNLTLSTSLYSLYAMGEGDTAENYQKAGFLNRIGLAATFAVDNKTNELANARRNNLSEWSAKVRLFGDRSTRSAKFQTFFKDKIEPAVISRLETLGVSIESLQGGLKSYVEMQRLSRRCLPVFVADRMKQDDYLKATDADKQAIIATLILGHLRANYFDRVQRENGELKLSPEQIAQIENDLLPRLRSALANLVKADADLKKELDDLSKGPLATFAYRNFRIPNGSDYSETKFLFEQDKGLFRPLKLVGNVGLSFYNKPDPLLNQKRLRDISGALSFEGSSKSPFTEAENQSRITYAFVGSYQRLFENRRLADRKPDIAAFQFVMEIPFIRGLSLPLSATYANATEEERKNHVRFNFGMRLDTDKLFELLKAASNR